jgi:hypothetical protein
MPGSPRRLKENLCMAKLYLVQSAQVEDFDTSWSGALFPWVPASPSHHTRALVLTTWMRVPPGLRVEMTGFGVTQGADEEDPGYRLAADAPVIHVRGVAYKGTVEISTRPPERPALRQ